MIKLFKGWYSRHFSTPGTIEFALVLLASFVVVYYFMWLVGPLVVALCIAYCLDWFVRLLIKKLNMKRMPASIITMVLFVGVSIGIMVFIVPKIVQQANQFYTNLQQISISAKGDRRDDFDTLVSTKTYEFIESLPDPIPSMFSQEEIDQYVLHARSSILSNITSIIRNQIMPSVVNVMTWLMYMIIVPIFTFLMLSNKETLQKRFGKYILPHNQKVMRDFWPKMNFQIESYIRGKILHIIIITIVNTLAFMILGVNYAFLLGFGVGLSVIVPYVGAAIITIPVVLIPIFQFGFCSYLIWIFAVYLVIQLLDSNVLTPMLFSKAMDLDAFSILSAVLIFGGLWGFWGVFFSIPLATFIGSLFTNWPNKESADNKATLDYKKSGDKKESAPTSKA
ncbi:putative permease [Succinivibrio dextrinosolvens]|uniref:AI-2E family transporter n=1 Tax=Succinivibrio dextrinosolvens TaxID=83771 RepID=UPI0008E22FE8|nr:AI-2E family transporter [Succinivibrio dextrinosolvens]SFS88313.1 putative permease [Succinivibrio dextrinosolvens]